MSEGSKSSCEETKESGSIKSLKDRKICKSPTKVIIRRLPPDIDKSTFFEQISPVPNHDYFYLITGDRSLGEYNFSRAYINFVNVEDIYIFKEKFDNYVFIDQKGHEYPAVVEFAAFQKIPKKRKSRLDPKCGTIESDTHYKDFFQSLNEQPTVNEKPEYSFQFSSEKKEEETTPLLEYVKQKKVDKQKLRDDRKDERKRRELERKKFKEIERKKFGEKFKPSKSYSHNDPKVSESKTKDKTDSVDISEESKIETVVEEKTFYKNNRKNFAKGNTFDEPREKYYQRSHGSFKRPEKYETEKQNAGSEKSYPKKVKKYSAIREERKNEFKKQENKVDSKSEQKQQDAKEIQDKTSDDKANIQKDTCKEAVENESVDNKEWYSNKEKDLKNLNKENDPRTRRRIRNKDRPTMAIYQPGMLSKRKQGDGTNSDNSTVKCDSLDKE